MILTTLHLYFPSRQLPRFTVKHRCEVERTAPSGLQPQHPVCEREGSSRKPGAATAMESISLSAPRLLAKRESRLWPLAVHPTPHLCFTVCTLNENRTRAPKQWLWAFPDPSAVPTHRHCLESFVTFESDYPYQRDIALHTIPSHRAIAFKRDQWGAGKRANHSSFFRTLFSPPIP